MSERYGVIIDHGTVVGAGPNHLVNLVDVNISNPTAGQAIGYDATNHVFVNMDIPSPEGKADKVSGATNGDLASLDSNGNLADSGVKLNITSPTAGQAITYDATNNEFVNSNIPSPEGKADKVSGATTGDLASLDSNGNLADSGVKLNVSSPTAGQALTYDATNNQFVNSNIPSPEGKADKVSGATAGHIATLDSNGNLVDGGHTFGYIPVNPTDTIGLNIWIET